MMFCVYLESSMTNILYVLVINKNRLPGGKWVVFDGQINAVARVLGRSRKRLKRTLGRQRTHIFLELSERIYVYCYSCDLNTSYVWYLPIRQCEKNNRYCQDQNLKWFFCSNRMFCLIFRPKVRLVCQY